MLTDDDLPPLRADKTHWHPLRGVHLRGSTAPVELELRWFWTAEHIRARSNVAFANLDPASRQRSEFSLIAKHLVVGWRNVPDRQGGSEPYDVESCEKLIAHIHAQALDVWTTLERVLCDPTNFGRPKLVDAEDLGKE